MPRNFGQIKKCFYLPTLSHASRQNLTKSLYNVNKRVKLISCFKLEYRYRLSVSANIGHKISVIGISVNFHIAVSLQACETFTCAHNPAKMLARHFTKKSANFLLSYFFCDCFYCDIFTFAFRSLSHVHSAKRFRT